MSDDAGGVSTKLPAECCATCKYWGGVYDSDRVPPGQCHERAPDKYQVQERSVPDPAGMFTLKVIESPFPGVWPYWKCGDYEPAAAAAKMETTPPDGPAGQRETKEAA
jgi:hypothetical protein